MAADEPDVQKFLDEVDEVSRLIEGLKAGTITPDYIDHKLEQKPGKQAPKAVAPQSDTKTSDAGIQDEARMAELQSKVQEIKQDYERKLKARQRYDAYVCGGERSSAFVTDYTKWDLWCPEDERDELINSMASSNPALRALEKDIDERHRRMVEQRQLAERHRTRGNAAYKAGNFSEALRQYEQGLDAQRHNLALHANAAMAALKLHCYVQAMEHCDKVLHIADALHNRPGDPLCVKAYQRRATAHQALGHIGKAVQDLKSALKIEPNNAELAGQLATAEQLYEEQKQQRKISKALEGGEAGVEDGSIDVAKLQRVERLVRQLQQAGVDVPAAVQSTAKAGLPQLPARSSAAATKGTLAAACMELAGLIRGDATACLHLKQCSGLEAAAALASSGSSSSSRSSSSCAGANRASASVAGSVGALELLNTAACCSDRALRALPSTGIITTCLDIITAAAAAAAAGTESASSRTIDASRQQQQQQTAALALLSTLTSAEDVRKQVSGVLSKSPTTLQHLLTCCLQLDAAGQVLLLLLLGNCSTDSIIKTAFARIMQQQQQQQQSATGDSVTALLARLLLAEQRPDVCERSLALVTNLCGDAACRQLLSSSPGIIHGMCTLVLGRQHSSSSFSCQLAAAGALFNLCMEPAAQQEVLRCCQLSALLELIQRPASSQLVLAARVAGIVSRLAKQPLACKLLQSPESTRELLGAISATLDGSVQAAESNKEACKALQEPLIRTLALLTASSSESLLQQLLQAGTAKVLVDLIRELSSEGHQQAQGVLGNAALCLGHLAGWQGSWAQLRQLDAVAVLVKIAYEGKGDGASKNSAIALAKLARDSKMLERLRELHGVEIIYQYVRP